MANVDLDQIRRNADIVKVISSYVTLQREGKSFVGICPFHNDTSPSMFVSPEKQIYKCFACGSGGNVFTFIRDFEKIAFMDAVKRVADLTGQKVEGLKESKKHEVKKENVPLYELLTELTNYYAYNLTNFHQSEAYQYVTSRIKETAVINNFKIGYAPKEETTIKFLKAKGYSIDDILLSGVGVEVNGVVYDRYAGRIIFPLFDTYGRINGLSGRKLPSADPEDAKYINTIETPIFHKSENIYNYYNAEQIAKRSGYVYLLEGYMDVIALARIGIVNAVASMGTSLTNEQVQLLKRWNVEIRLCFDNDKAGQTATLKALKLLTASNIKVRIVKANHAAKDPDEILNSEGKEELEKFLNDLLSPSDFRFDYLAKYVDVNNYEDKKNFLYSFLKEMAEDNLSTLEEDYYQNKLSVFTNFSLSAIKEIYAKIKNQPKGQTSKGQKVISNHKPVIDKYQQAEEDLILYMLKDNKVIELYEDKLGGIKTDAYRGIVACIVNYYREYGQVTYADLYSDEYLQDNVELIKVLHYLDFEKPLPNFSNKYFEILNDEYSLVREIEELRIRIEEALDNKKKFELATKRSQLIKKLNEIKKN